MPDDPGSLILPAALAAAIRAHAAELPALEVCGLLGARAGRLCSSYRVCNVAATPARAFLMDPAGQIAAMKTMRALGEELAGIYHSHPATAPEPSPTDAALAAYPGVAYLISGPWPDCELRAWRWDGTRFHSLALVLR